ncbi:MULTISPECIES: GGDEF domain-containing protein [Myxococcaceae]|uniref:GGDEF domain-containing protein n=1 Tax=Myxococcaceae TaxID=31 RepID=UPI00188FF119|nr:MULTISPECIES: GGDEF domain-containing protein [Myxococcaceae]MBF5045711.1 GGDEF domain-containing protein [Simulacricoccus sp. 17bor-14]
MRRGDSFYRKLALLLGLGAPLGWLVLQALRARLPGGSVAAELRGDWVLYLYLWVGSTLTLGALGWFADALARANSQLRGLAVTDATTGLKNTRYFHDRLRRELVRAGREGRPLCLVAADLDHFKRVNDVYGHATGDLVLARVAQVMEACLRASDVACRVGGEEFSLILPGALEQDALRVAERIRLAVAGLRIATPKGLLQLSLSLGVSCCAPGETGESLAMRADAALYAAKRGGRNRVELAAPPSSGLQQPG